MMYSLFASMNDLRSLQIKDTFTITLLNRKKAINNKNNNKLYRWGEIYVPKM